jgi:hypothetical protein
MNIYDRFEKSAEDSSEKIRGLEAAGVALRHLMSGRTVMVGDMPLRDLVARDLGLEEPGRIAADHEVGRFWKSEATS